VKTLLPVSPDIYRILERFDYIHIVEENLNGIYREILYGQAQVPGVFGVNKIGQMITPSEIIKSLDK